MQPTKTAQRDCAIFNDKVQQTLSESPQTPMGYDWQTGFTYSDFADLDAVEVRTATGGWLDFVARVKTPKRYANKNALPLFACATFGATPKATSDCLRHGDNMSQVVGPAKFNSQKAHCTA